jgi:hypothetical protein
MHDFCQQLTEKIESQYRNLVARVAKGETPKTDESLAVLCCIGRKPGQLSADVDRLRQRRDAASRLPAAEELTPLIAKSREKALKARTVLDVVRIALNRQEADFKPCLESQRRLNLARKDYADAEAEERDATEKFQALVANKEHILRSANGVLSSTASPVNDIGVPENFALTD